MMDESSWRILVSSFFFFLLLSCQASTNSCGDALEELEEQLPEDYLFRLSSNFTKDKKVSRTEAICRLKYFLMVPKKIIKDVNETFLTFLLDNCNLSKTCETTKLPRLNETLFMTVKDFIGMIGNDIHGGHQNVYNEQNQLKCNETSKATASAMTTAATPSQTQKSTALPTRTAPIPSRSSPQPPEYIFDTQREMASFSLLGISILLNIILIFVVIHLMTRIRHHSNNMSNGNGDRSPSLIASHSLARMEMD
ncbi:uncharacterized protein LOC134008954 [Osmerus eperlanus]|uniref:uncharacterized protein LOC134008954 n=1 Tax=Osmerus eperlanus TaxID=29151 RepID=UPI002E0F21CB